MLTIDSIPLGSVVRVLGCKDDNTTREIWFAQVNNIDVEREELEVAVLQKAADGDGLLCFTKDGYVPQHVPLTSIIEFQPIEPMHSMRAHQKAWHKIGVRLVRSTAHADYFIEREREEDHGAMDIGAEIDEYCSSDDGADDDYDCSFAADPDTPGSLRDFIVDDDEAEPFTHAGTADEFVNTTHKAVHEYNDWVPKTPREERIKSFIDNLESKYAHKDADVHFKRGQAGPSYTKPPTT